MSSTRTRRRRRRRRLRSPAQDPKPAPHERKPGFRRLLQSNPSRKRRNTWIWTTIWMAVRRHGSLQPPFAVLCRAAKRNDGSARWTTMSCLFSHRGSMKRLAAATVPHQLWVANGRLRILPPRRRGRPFKCSIFLILLLFYCCCNVLRFHIFLVVLMLWILNGHGTLWRGGRRRLFLLFLLLQPLQENGHAAF